MSLDIVGMGEPLIELNQTDPGSGYLPGFGGDTSNAVIAAARCGARAGYFTAVGKDAFGQMLLDLWRAEEVDASRVILDSRAPTGLYFVTHSAAGHEFSYMRTGSAASRIGPGQVPADYIVSARILHVSGISQAIAPSAADAVFHAIDIAKRAGRLVSYDTNLRLKLWPLARARAITHEAMRNVDIALPGLEDARQLTGLHEADAIADFYLRLGASVVALTLGREGCLVATATARRRLAAHHIEAIDATGAGDAFDGAFLAEYLATDDPFQAGAFANAAAALSTQGYGAVGPLPRRPRVEEALRKTGEPAL